MNVRIKQPRASSATKLRVVSGGMGKGTMRELSRGNCRANESLDLLIGESAAIRRLKEKISLVANSSANVLVCGESGTGKELVAKAIHLGGSRAMNPFVPVNCGALVSSLLETEFFGHVRGAFSGAAHTNPGLFVSANGGTIFLDEIGDLPVSLQPKLLRVLQEREVHPIGALIPIPIDTRIIAATNVDLNVAVEEGRFREDLFYRLNVIPIDVPALRDRKLDIPLLVDFFLENGAHRTNREKVGITADAVEWLSVQEWPGNVRELQNTIERAVVLSEGNVLGLDDFSFCEDAAVENFKVGELCSLNDLEKAHILRVLDACGGHKAKAASILKINRTTLWKKLREYGIN